MSQKIDSLVHKFITYSSKSYLNKQDRQDAKFLMIQLREAGMSCKEVSDLSSGKWKTSSVASYTVGVKESKTGQYHDVVDFLKLLDESGYTFEQVKSGAALLQDIKTKGVKPDDVADVVFDADAANVELADVVDLVKDATDQGLPIEAAVHAIETLIALKEKGIGLQEVMSLHSALEQYGNPDKTLEAVSMYETLESIEHQRQAEQQALAEEQAHLENVQAAVKEAEQQLDGKQAEKEAIEQVTDIVYTPELLHDLADKTKKLGGVDAFLEAMSVYKDIHHLTQERQEAQHQADTAKSEATQLWADHANLKTAVGMCLDMVEHQGLGPDGIAALLALAKQYGDPIEVLKAVEGYGALEKIREAAAVYAAQADDAKKRTDEQEGRYQSILDKMDKLDTRFMEVGKLVGNVEVKVAEGNYLQRLLRLVNEPHTVEFGNTVNVALMCTNSLKAYVNTHRGNFKHESEINHGLSWLIADLGGISLGQ